MLLGVVLHAALTFFPKAWPVQDRSAGFHGPWEELFFAVHGFRMPVFFLLSGFFTAMLWRRRGLPSLIRHRLRRVALPLALAMVTVAPAMDWVVDRAAAAVPPAGLLRCVLRVRGAGVRPPRPQRRAPGRHARQALAGRAAGFRGRGVRRGTRRHLSTGGPLVGGVPGPAGAPCLGHVPGPDRAVPGPPDPRTAERPLWRDNQGENRATIRMRINVATRRRMA